MRSIFVLLILVMIGLNGKGQSVTALPDSVLSQCCLEVTLLNGNVTTVDWVFIQYITRDGTGTKLFVEYAPNFGGIQWETQIRIQNDFDEVIERSKFIILPFTVGSTDYGIHRNWIANIEENATTGGTWIYGRFGTPTKRKFSAVEDYETLKALLLACLPRAIVVAENGLYTEGDTVRMGGILIENTRIETDTFDFEMIDILTSTAFGIDHNTPETGDVTTYWARRSGSIRQMIQMGEQYWMSKMTDTISGLYSRVIHNFADDGFLTPGWEHLIFNPSDPTSGIMWARFYRDQIDITISNEDTNPVYTPGLLITPTQSSLGVSETGGVYPGNGPAMGVIGYGAGIEMAFIKTKKADDNTALVGQFLQLKDLVTSEVEYATAIVPGDTAAMLANYVDGAGTLNYIPKFTGTRTIGNSNLTDDNTRVRVENGKPFSLAKVATTGLPTGEKSYMVYDTTQNGIRWYNGTRWATALESTFARGTATFVPFFDANGQIVQGTATGQGLRYYNAGGNLHILEAKSAIEAKGVTGINGGNADLVAASATNVGRWSFSVSESTGAFSFYDAVSLQTPVTIAKNSGSNRLTFNSTTTALSSTTLLSLTSATVSAITGSNTLSAGTGLTDALGGASGSLRTVNGSNIFSWSPASTSPYLAITNGTQRGYFQATTLDGIRIGSSTAHPFIFLTNATERAQITSGGNFLIGTTTDVSRRLHVSGEARITDLTTDTPTRIVGADGDGDLGAMTVSGGLSITSGVLSSTWLKPQLESGSATINAAANADLFINNLDSVKFGKTLIRSSNNGLLILNPDVGASGISAFGAGYHTVINGNVSGSDGGTGHIVIGGTATANTTGSIFNVSIGYISNTQGAYASAFGYNADATADNTLAIGRNAVANENGEISIGSVNYVKMNLDADTTRAIGLMGVDGTPNHPAIIGIATYDADKILGLAILGDGFSYDGDTLTASGSADGNGIYTGSGTLSSTKTRALISPNNKLSFSQVYNAGADSARITITNYNEDGFRAIEMELLDTVHVGGKAKLSLIKDENNDIMSLRGEVEDQDGATSYTATGSGFGITSNSFSATTDFVTFTGSEVKMSAYGDGDMTAANLGFSNPTYISAFAPTGSGQGTVLDLKLGTGLAISGGELVATGATVELKKDTTIYVTDADYNFSAALTTAQINTRYNRIIIFMTCSSSAADHNTLTMHTPDANLAQCEIVVYSIDDNPTWRNDITFGASNLLSPTGSLNTTYNLSAGQWLHVRVADVSGYKYFISY